jgi:hypothetical protein
MRDWLTYSLSDFLLFSPRTYYRMFELYHREIWPAHVLVVVLVSLMVFALVRPQRHRDRIVAVALALAWLWGGIAFHIQRYASINWAATYFGALFIVQAALLAWVGVTHAPSSIEGTSPSRNRVGAMALLAAAVLTTIVGSFTDRSWSQVEVFGLTPDATAVATIVLLAFVPIYRRRLLLVVPLIWCVIGAATLWALGSNEAWLSIVAVVVAWSSLRRMTPSLAR